MNSFLPPASGARPFPVNQRKLLSIAIAMAVYGVGVLYMAFLGLRYLTEGITPDPINIIWAVGLAVAFMLYAFHNMKDLTGLNRTEKNK